MSTPILIATTCRAVQVVGGADQCSRRCKHFQAYSGDKCAMFGPIELKPKTKRTYLRAQKCIVAERLAGNLTGTKQMAGILAATERGRIMGETGAF